MSIISEPLNRVSLLAKDHKGMRVDYSGLFRQARTALRHGAKEPALAEMLRQFQDHLTELGTRWYAGDTAVVDELLQLYCVEKGARDALAAAPLTREAAPVEELPPLPHPYEIDWPELHSQALGCGVEDRNIQDRYEAAEYGWQDGVDKAVERVPEEIFTADQMREYARAASAMGPQFAASDGLTRQAIGLLKRVRMVHTGESRQPEAVERDVKDFLALHGNTQLVAGDTGAIAKLIEKHAELLDANPYAYFELAYTRQTDWMAWLTDRPARGELGTAEYAKSRKVIARGQGATAIEACEDALTLLKRASLASAVKSGDAT